MGENVEVSSAREMFMGFIELLYTLDADKLQEMASTDWKSASASTPMITNDSSKLRGPKELLNTNFHKNKHYNFFFIKIM